MSAAVDHGYRYLFESSVEAKAGTPALQLATSGGTADNPFFFQGKMRAPELSATLLSTLSRVVGSRFYVPPAMLARILALADPVVTSGEGMLRFEGFSSCASAYARVDFTPDAHDGQVVSSGTTNVDFNAKMRGTLASLRDRDGMELSVGREEVRLTRGEETVVERKVALPLRWLKGFVEVQAYAARMQPFAEIGGVEALRFVRALPRTASRQEQWLQHQGRGVRLAHTRRPGALRVGGVERLRVLEPLLARCKRLNVYADADGQASTWQLDFDIARFSLTISGDVWRGFSGEGQALGALRQRKTLSALVPALRACLAWQVALEPGALAARIGRTEDEVHAALQLLGARGLVGFDQHAARYFHRELPFDLSKLEALAPRLRAAQQLLEREELKQAPADPGLVLVPSGGVVHRVELRQDGARCTCPWFAKHQGARGPCKHVLAAETYVEGLHEHRRQS
ncbi:MAG: SWIM zinc finger family protein [Polyangiaceae bacterium]